MPFSRDRKWVRIGAAKVSSLFESTPFIHKSKFTGPILEMEKVLIAPLMLKCLNFLEMALGSRENPSSVAERKIDRLRCPLNGKEPKHRHSG